MGVVSQSGAKSSDHQPRYDLIPLSAMQREAARMAEGAAKHGENNYQLGVNDPAFVRERLNHLVSHALKYLHGDRSDDHLAAVRCNAGMLIWLEEHAQESAGVLSPDMPAYPETRYVGPEGYTIPVEERMAR